MKHFNIRRLFQYISAVGFCFVLLLETAINTKLIIPYTEALIKRQCSFSETRKKISDFYVSEKFRGKYRLLELNGFIARYTGRRAYNNVTLLKNGMLGGNVDDFFEPKDPEPLADKVICFSEYLDSLKTPFVYVQVPYKMDMGGKLLPKGLKDYPNVCADCLVQTLKNEGVRVLDLREELTSDIKTTEEFFYRTDHHWTPDGAMIAFRRVMEYLRDETDPGLNIACSDSKNWERHKKEKWFLGSRGKRVGPFFAGVDSLIWYTPGFRAEDMSCEIPNHNWLYEGDFSDANIRRGYIDERDYYSKNSYGVYIGGDYPIVKHRNPHAPNKKKILILKDSFVLPLQAFMSTEFTELDVIDPRHYKESIEDYCRENRPDAVIMIINVSCISDSGYLKIK